MTYQVGVCEGGAAGEQFEQQHPNGPEVDGPAVALRQHHLRGFILRRPAQLRYVVNQLRRNEYRDGSPGRFLADPKSTIFL